MWQKQKRGKQSWEINVEENTVATLWTVLVYRNKELSHFCTLDYILYVVSFSRSLDGKLHSYLHWKLIEKLYKFHVLWLGGNQKSQPLDTVEVHIRSSWILYFLGSEQQKTRLCVKSASEEGHSVLLRKTCQKWENSFWHCLLLEVGLPLSLHYW